MLPPERLKAICRNYSIRASVVAIVLVTALVLASAILLLPTYVLLAKSIVAKEKHLANIESSFSSADEAELTIRLSALSDNAKILSTLGNAPSASVIIRDALAVPHTGIILSGLAYTPVAGKNSATLAISGMASSRDALHNYQTVLQSAAFAASVSLPVSAYAKDTDISFTITMTLKP